MTLRPFARPVRSFSQIRSIIAAGLLLSAATGAAAQTAQERCSQFTNRVVGEAKINTATFKVASGAFPEYCSLQGVMPSALKFEIRLPTTWNNRLHYTGTGGYAGTIAAPSSAILKAGYVSVASNGGHTGSFYDATFALDEDQLNDYAYLSVHRVVTVAKQVVSQRYGKPAAKSYFEGCSNGGREGLIAAQRYPSDFNGIIARAPSYALTEVMITRNRNTKQFQKAGGNLPPAKVALLGKAIMNKCDGLDNLRDGIISRPAACSFDPAVLQCSSGDSDSCLTAEQVRSAKLVYAPMVLNGKTIYPGYTLGGEAVNGGWNTWVTGGDFPANSGWAKQASPFIKYFITRNPNYNQLYFDPNNWLTQISSMTSLLSANDKRLYDFKSRGGKLILWHGGSDFAVSQKATNSYYQGVVANNGTEATKSFLEYYQAPGVNHCGGGNGAGSVDFMPALVKWVETGVAPASSRIVARGVNPATGTSLSRPLCKYPQYPRYNGSGDTTSAANFTCVN